MATPGCGSAPAGMASAYRNATRSASLTLRSSVVTRAVAAPPRPAQRQPVLVPELLDDRAVDPNLQFEDYKQATQMLSKLKGRGNDLEQLLDQLNAFEASLDPELLAPPVEENLNASAERARKRQAKRAARRAEATAVTVSAAAAPSSAARPVSVVSPASDVRHAPSTSARGSSAMSGATLGGSESGSRSSAASSSSSVLQLEELFKLTFSEEAPATSKPPVLTPKKASSVLAPRKGARKAAAAAAPAPAPLAAAAPQPAAVAPAPVSAPTEESLSDRLDRLLGTQASPVHEDLEDEPSRAAAGPSDDDLFALEREAESLLAAMNDDEEAEGSGSLEVSALAVREPEQVSVMPAGPSLLSLVPASAAPSQSARLRQARRSARNGRGSSLAGSAGSDLGASGRAGKAGRDGTTSFLRKSTDVGILDMEVEKEVTEVCRDFLFLEKVRRQCQKTLHRAPTTEEVAAAVGMDVRSFQMRHEAGLRAKELLLKANYRLVMTVCKKFIGKGVQVQDLISEGVKGLLKGVEKYDASRGFRFGTYAHWWIRQAVSRSMAETSRAVRLPINMIEQLMKLKTVTADLSASLGRDPTVEELAQASGMPASRVDLLLKSARAASSMEAPMSSSGDSASPTIKDNVEDDSMAPDEEFGSSSLRDDMEAMLADLNERESRVVRLRFGLEDGREWTLEEIGDALQVTRERIRQIEAKALRKLQVKSIEPRGSKLREYSKNLDMMSIKEVAARTSSGTRKT